MPIETIHRTALKKKSRKELWSGVDRRLYHSRRRAESDGYKSLRHVRCWIGPAGSIMPPPVYGISREDGRKKGEGGKKQLVVIVGGLVVDDVVDEVVL